LEILSIKEQPLIGHKFLMKKRMILGNIIEWIKIQ
jgi:hypothetical protein